MTAEVKEKVERLLRSGERTEAIQYLKSSFNVTDAEANLLVATLEKETVVPSPKDSPVLSPADDDALKAEVAELVRTGRQSEALKLVRERRHLGFKEALLFIGQAAGPANINTTSGHPAGCLRVIAKAVGVFIMVVSALLIAGAVVVYFVQESSISNSDRVEGTVVKMIALESGESAPVIEFEWRGNQRSYKSTFYSSPPDHQEGERMFAFVNRDDPEDVMLDTFSGRWAIIVGLAVPGLAFLLISIVVLYFARSKF